MQRITDKDLQAVVDRINRTMGTPMQPYATGPDGKHAAQIGCYHYTLMGFQVSTPEQVRTILLVAMLKQDTQTADKAMALLRLMGAA